MENVSVNNWEFGIVIIKNENGSHIDETHIFQFQINQKEEFKGYFRVDFEGASKETSRRTMRGWGGVTSIGLVQFDF